MAGKTSYRSPVGVEVWKGDWEEAEWTITGYPKKEFTVRDFDSAYDFEDFVKEKVSCKGISFDSESCQFFAYAKTEARAKKFAKDIEAYFKSVQNLLNIK